MAHFRIRYNERGGHTHMSIFAGPASNLTHGKCGDLSMTNEEFAQFKAATRSSDFEFIDNDEREDTPHMRGSHVHGYGGL